MLHLFAPFLHRGSHKQKIQSEWCSWYISPNWTDMKRFRFIHRRNEKIISKVSVSRAMPSRFPPWKLMMPWWNSDPCLSTLGAKNTTKNPSLCYHTYPGLHVYMVFCLAGFLPSSGVWFKFWHIISIYFLIFQVTFNTPNYHMFFIFEVSWVYILLPTSWYFFFCHQKKLMNFCPPRWSHARILVWLGYLELFGFLAIINMQEGKTVFWLNSKTPLKSLKGITTGGSRYYISWALSIPFLLNTHTYISTIYKLFQNQRSLKNSWHQKSRKRKLKPGRNPRIVSRETLVCGASILLMPRGNTTCRRLVVAVFVFFFVGGNLEILLCSNGGPLEWWVYIMAVYC